ncbi:uncharacterized protein LTR77_003493 [Saxophila tyrrhenica]|uniref:Uncharacterized protein n=1 Tax=Saxophila tyrrhenica TaxID=1690608 RepID=A0AAV9PI04_9PEZI|nr:hypothetical protein LTR77_003493 [Saxophila tyrrhenica]
MGQCNNLLNCNRHAIHTLLRLATTDVNLRHTFDIPSTYHLDESSQAAPRYNTHDHSLTEITTAMGTAASRSTHTDPQRHLYAYPPYAAAMTTSQRIPPPDCHTLRLPSFLLHEIDKQAMRHYNARSVSIGTIMDDMMSIRTIKDTCRATLTLRAIVGTSSDYQMLRQRTLPTGDR